MVPDRNKLLVGEYPFQIGASPGEIGPSGLKEAGLRSAPILNVIRAYCIDCAGGSKKEANSCTAIRCHLWPYRMGVNPFRPKQVLSDEHKAKLFSGLKNRGVSATG